MKIPKQIIIDGRTWKVILEKKERGGWFICANCEIHVGMQKYTQEEICQIFFHEVFEAILSNRLLRYKLPFVDDDNGNFIFVFNHIQMTLALNDFYLAIRDMLK